MTGGRKSDLDRRLEAYFANLRSRSLKHVLRRSAGNWPLYAAVTGSAMALATGVSASLIGDGTRGTAAAAIASVLAARPIGGSKNGRRMPPLLNAVQLTVPGQAPSITPGGVVPLCGVTSTIQAGEWVTIYGTNLASVTATWNNDFPLSLGGTSVTIDGKAAYLMYVSPGQINLQAPDDPATGTVAVVVTTGSGSATSYVTLDQFAPSFSLLDSKHVSAIILRPNKTGAYGGGTYDILGPTGNTLGYPTVAANPGDSVELFAVGFGPTTPVVPAGQAFSSAAPVDNPLNLSINSVPVEPTFVGLSSAGIYQINLIVPHGLGEGEVSLQAMIGSMQTQPGVLFSLASSGVVVGGGGTGTVGGGGGTFIPPSLGFSSGGTGGGTGGTGSDRKRRRKPYQPKLTFPPK